MYGMYHHSAWVFACLSPFPLENKEVERSTLTLEKVQEMSAMEPQQRANKRSDKVALASTL